MKQRNILFLCTGNYYRSRFAEAMFNYYAEKQQLEFRAFSRGLQIDSVKGPISPYTLQALANRKVAASYTSNDRISLCEQDLSMAELVIALKEHEHRPMIRQKFPHWEHRIEYWHVDDIDQAPPKEAMALIDSLVLQLIKKISK